MGQDQKARCRRGAGQHQQLAYAESGRQTSAEEPGREPDDPLGRDGQSREQRRLMQRPLQVVRQHQHLAGDPQTDQERQRTGRSKAGNPQQFESHQRLGLVTLDHHETASTEDGHSGRCTNCDRGPPEGHTLRESEHRRGSRTSHQRGAAEVEAEVAIGDLVPIDPSRCQHRDDEPNGDVDEEHGSPTGELDQDASEHLAGDEADRGRGPV